MIQSVIKNEIYMATRYIKTNSLDQDGVCTVGDEHFAEYLKAAAKSLDCDTKFCPDANSIESGCSRLWYILNADSYSESDLAAAIKMAETDSTEFLCIILLSNIKPSGVIEKYSEMELLTVMDSVLGKIRNILSSYKNAKAVILDRLVGAEFDCLSLRSIAKEAQQEHTVSISQNMANTYVSALYLPDAINAVYTVSKLGKAGNVYNASSFYFSEFQLRSKIYAMLARHSVSLKISGENSGESVYAAMSNGKLRSLGYRNVCSQAEALRYLMLSCLERFSIQTDRIRNGYSGKLDTMRSLEKDMLREIDRICRQHGIKYFICYGTMLGAVRHGGFIPWDDDVDVAMLRSEFEKFRRVAPSELNEKFSYESHTNHNGYHYFFDRISAKDTYFSSKYSDGYEMHKGVSVDIFVVDNVPADPKAAYRFWKKLMRKRMIMNVRWKNTARHGKAYLLSKLILPILRLRSMDSYSRSYEKTVRKYEHKNTGRVMPASSDHVYRGTFPTETFNEVIPYRFDDVDTFVPTGYKDFLKAWYTERYMEMLPLCEQNPFHEYYRLDLGSNIEPDSSLHFDYMGELK